jgi:large subunit ribosomal protein L6
MSRLAKKPILVPEKTEIKILDGVVSVKGPLGELKKSYSSKVKIALTPEGVMVTADKLNPETKSFLGTYVSHIRNMIKGVNSGFSKKLIIEGIGFKAEVKGAELILNLGFSHPVKVLIPAGLKVVVEKGAMTVSGFDKELVGEYAAKIRSLKKPEPYKGKGIRYEGEVIKMKQGKKTV